MTKPTGFTIYQGPSMIDGTPIVAIAVLGSSNRKTGNMVQTYILRQDMRPVQAVQTGADVAICGDCKHRPSNGGACYVVVAQGPTVVYKTWVAGKYPTATAKGIMETLDRGWTADQVARARAVVAHWARIRKAQAKRRNPHQD